MLSQTQVECFREQGFSNLGRVFDTAELETIAREYDRLVTPGQVLGSEADGVFSYRAMLNFRSPEMKRIVSHPTLLAIAVDLLGEDIRFWWDQGINKPPGAGSVIAWHQDNGNTPGRIPEYLTCWLALDDSTRENGGLEVVPGSHKGGQLVHELHSVHWIIPDAEVETQRAVALDARAGDLLVFSSLLVHQTVGNHTVDRQRRAWVIQYCRGDQRNEVTGECYDDRPWVVQNGTPVPEPWAERPFDLRRNA